MSGGVTVTNANPLDMGADVNSVESAAQGFTELLSSNDAPRPRSSGRRKPEEDDNTLFPDFEGNPDAVPGDDDSQSPAPRRARAQTDDEIDEDPILNSEEISDEDEEGDEENPDEGEEADEDEGEPEGDDEGDDIDPDREFVVTIDGEETPVKFAELISGYSREADYRNKTSELAREREEFEGWANSVIEERKAYSETLDNWISMTAALEPSQQEWDALKAQNPQLYIQTKEQWDGIKAKVEEAKAEKAKVDAKAAEEETRKYNAWVRSQNQTLVEKVPALKNPKKAKAFREAIFTYGKAAGYSEEELLTGAVDARDVLTLYKASRYDQIMESRKANAKNPGRKKAPQPAVTTRPRSVGKQGNKGNRRAARDFDSRLARSGSVDDAALAFTEMLKG